jgi:hypothetical protein
MVIIELLLLRVCRPQGLADGVFQLADAFGLPA